MTNPPSPKYIGYSIDPAVKHGAQFQKWLVTILRIRNQHHFPSYERAKQYAERYIKHYHGGTKQYPVWCIGELNHGPLHLSFVKTLFVVKPNHIS